jgi:Secretion system C-terminal sorting domain
MKKIFSILAAGFISFSANAQCSNVANNFEIKLTQTNDQTLKIQMRHHADAVAGAKSFLPTTATQFDGLVIAITWPNTSNVSLTKCTSTSSVVDLIFDEPTPQNKMSTEKIQTLFHNNIATMPKAFDANWTNDKWYDVATVTFNGQLAKGDYFSLLNCDYGLAHPNSYSGNSTTDPWMSMIEASGNFLQVSPKMITELPTGFTNSFNIYPVPTTGELNIDVDCATKTSAVVKVLDMNGRLVKTVLFELEKGKNTNTINIGELPIGEYMIQLTDGKAVNFSKQITKI